MNSIKTKKDDSARGIAQRTKGSKKVFEETGDRNEAIHEYCRGNRWLEENARAVGNW